MKKWIASLFFYFFFSCFECIHWRVLVGVGELTLFGFLQAWTGSPWLCLPLFPSPRTTFRTNAAWRTTTQCLSTHWFQRTSTVTTTRGTPPPPSFNQHYDNHMCISQVSDVAHGSLVFVLFWNDIWCSICSPPATEDDKFYRRKPLSVTELFRELISQRLAQGFQIITKKKPPKMPLDPLTVGASPQYQHTSSLIRARPRSGPQVSKIMSASSYQ